MTSTRVTNVLIGCLVGVLVCSCPRPVHANSLLVTVVRYVVETVDHVTHLLKKKAGTETVGEGVTRSAEDTPPPTPRVPTAARIRHSHRMKASRRCGDGVWAVSTSSTHWVYTTPQVGSQTLYQLAVGEGVCVVKEQAAWVQLASGGWVFRVALDM